jgi:hypothetical protein
LNYPAQLKPSALLDVPGDFSYWEALRTAWLSNSIGTPAQSPGLWSAFVNGSISG